MGVEGNISNFTNIQPAKILVKFAFLSGIQATEHVQGISSGTRAGGIFSGEDRWEQINTDENSLSDLGKYEEWMTTKLSVM